MQINLEPIFVREKMLAKIREFFTKQGFHEVVVPVLNTALPLEPTLFSFQTEWKTTKKNIPFYLSVSPEAGLKKMLAAGIGNCFAIGKCFRNLESSGRQHNPEFLMLEWYRENATSRSIVEDVKKLLDFLSDGLAPQWSEISLEKEFVDKLGVNLFQILTDKAIQDFVVQHGYQTKNASWEQLFNQLVLNEIEPYFPKTPFFLVDFPARLSPLCKIQKKKEYLADRFEVYLNGMEVGNGNTEETDAEKVRKLMKAEKKFREDSGLSLHPIDEEFLESLETLNKTGKSYAGIGMGIDRLAMVFAGVKTMREVEPFAV